MFHKSLFVQRNLGLGNMVRFEMGHYITAN